MFDVTDKALGEQVTGFLKSDGLVSYHLWFKECLNLAIQIAAYPDKNWLLYEDDFYQFSVYFYALLLAKKNIVLAQSKQVERIREVAGSADIYIGEMHLEAEHYGLPLFVSSNTTESGQIQSQIENKIDPNQCITFFTSGSTGNAKAIKKYWYQLTNEIKILEQVFGSSKPQWVLSTVTHKHIYGLLFKLLWPVSVKNNIVTETVEYPEQAQHFISKLGSHILFVSSPAYLTRIAQNLCCDELNKTERIFSSGGPLSSQAAQALFELSDTYVTEIYGSTESGGIAWRQQLLNASWQLFPSHQAELSSIGTLMLSSSFLPRGQTLTTDDRVEINGSFFELKGRIDRIIKLHEKRISLDEMESLLSSHQYIQSCHCRVIGDESEVLIALVVLSPEAQNIYNSQGKRQTVNYFKRLLLDKFETSVLPRKWRFLSELPYNAQGKLVKSVIEELKISSKISSDSKKRFRSNC